MPPRGSRSHRISVPLYAAGLVATLCGVLTVADTIDDSAFTFKIVTLTLLGFAFSLGCRALGIGARFVGWFCVAFIAVGMVGTLTNRVDLSVLVPESVSKNDAHVAVVLCWGAMLLSWTLLQDVTVLFTPLIAIATIGLTASFDLNDYVATYFALLLIATIFLLTHYQSLIVRAAAMPAEQNRASHFGLPVQAALAAICGLAVLGLGLLLIVPVEALTHNLSLAGAIRRIATLSAAQPSNGAAIRFSDDTDFEIGTGKGWSASPAVLARVTPSDDQPHLWRGRTYDHYNGSGWESNLRDQIQSPGLPITDSFGDSIYRLATADYAGRPVLFASFNLLGDTNQFYYATVPRRLALPPGLTAPPLLLEDGRLVLADQRSLSGMQYMEASLLAPDPLDPTVQDRLRHAGANYPPMIRAAYLGNMADQPNAEISKKALAYFRRAVNACVRSLPRRRRAPIDIVLALRDWVSGHCIYSLDVEPIAPKEDHVYEFLAHTRRGYCDLFASSLTVLCRVAGIPARVATGFASGQREGASYNLRALDRHAWTEVYFPGSGWLQFDATMGTRTDGSVPGATEGSAWTWARFLRRLGPLPLGLALVIGLLLLYVALNEWSVRRRRIPAASPVAARKHGDAGRRYARLTRALAGLALVREAAETPSGFAARAVRFLEAHPATGLDPVTTEAVTAEWNRIRYGGMAQEGDPAADRAVGEFIAAASRLRRRLFWETVRDGIRSVFGKRSGHWN